VRELVDSKSSMSAGLISFSLLVARTWHEAAWAVGCGLLLDVKSSARFGSGLRVKATLAVLNNSGLLVVVSLCAWR